jgi:putative PIN family toxin of toxin-antitoxin system
MLAAVIDTNVWISAFLNPAGNPARVYQAARAGHFVVIISRPLLAELAEVLIRPRLQHTRQLTKQQIEVFISGIEGAATQVPVTGSLALCRDPNDDMVLETAMAGKANYIVSRDEDLTRDLDLRDTAAARNIQIVTVAQFLKQLA